MCERAFEGLGIVVIEQLSESMFVAFFVSALVSQPVVVFVDSASIL